VITSWKQTLSHAHGQGKPEGKKHRLHQLAAGHRLVEGSPGVFAVMNRPAGRRSSPKTSWRVPASPFAQRRSEVRCRKCQKPARRKFPCNAEPGARNASPGPATERGAIWLPAEARPAHREKLVSRCLGRLTHSPSPTGREHSRRAPRQASSRQVPCRDGLRRSARP